MAAPLQTFLFNYGKAMAGKDIGLIVSSASSGISGVESDAKRLILEGRFLSPSLWIRSSQTSNAKSILENWLKTIGYDNLTTSIDYVGTENPDRFTAYSLSGVKILNDAESVDGLSAGLYIINGKKTVITK